VIARESLFGFLGVVARRDFALAWRAMVKYEPPYVVHMMDRAGAWTACAAGGVVYSSGNPAEAEAFAASLCDAGAWVVEVRDSKGNLVSRLGGTS
jgi:hypothetical protein